jgi:hypothetical protein
MFIQNDYSFTCEDCHNKFFVFCESSTVPKINRCCDYLKLNNGDNFIKIFKKFTNNQQLNPNCVTLLFLYNIKLKHSNSVYIDPFEFDYLYVKELNLLTGVNFKLDYTCFYSNYVEDSDLQDFKGLLKNIIL